MAGLPPIWTLIATALPATGGSARYGAPAGDPILSIATRDRLWPAADQVRAPSCRNRLRSETSDDR